MPSAPEVNDQTGCAYAVEVQAETTKLSVTANGHSKQLVLQNDTAREFAATRFTPTVSNNPTSS